MQTQKLVTLCCFKVVLRTTGSLVLLGKRRLWLLIKMSTQKIKSKQEQARSCQIMYISYTVDTYDLLWNWDK